MLEKKTSFTATFENNCRKNSVPQCLYSLVNMILRGPNIQNQSNDVTIIDGAAAINMLRPTPAVKTFYDYAKQVFIPYIKGQLQHAKRVDVVWDEYTPNNEETTRKKREKGIRRKVKSSTKLPSNWHEFLRKNENKTKLFAFLANRTRFWPTSPLQSASG